MPPARQINRRPQTRNPAPDTRRFSQGCPPAHQYLETRRFNHIDDNDDDTIFTHQFDEDSDDSDDSYVGYGYKCLRCDRRPMAVPRAIVRDMEGYSWTNGDELSEQPGGDAYCAWCHITWWANMVEPALDMVYVFENTILPAHPSLVDSLFVHLEMRFLPLMHRAYFPALVSGAPGSPGPPLGFVRNVCIRGRAELSMHAREYREGQEFGRDPREEILVPRHLNRRTWSWEMAPPYSPDCHDPGRNRPSA